MPSPPKKVSNWCSTLNNKTMIALLSVLPALHEAAVPRLLWKIQIKWVFDE